LPGHQKKITKQFNHTLVWRKLQTVGFPWPSLIQYQGWICELITFQYGHTWTILRVEPQVKCVVCQQDQNLELEMEKNY
jgi:hypothetical protein